jgi:hypothetical protein
MKKLLFFFSASLFLISCGNDAAIKNDVKKLVELKCKMKQSFDKIMEINKQVQNIPKPNLDDNASILKYHEQQNKFFDELKEIEKVDNELLDEFKKAEKEIKEKYNSDSDKTKLEKEVALQLSASGCD